MQHLFAFKDDNIDNNRNYDVDDKVNIGGRTYIVTEVINRSADGDKYSLKLIKKKPGIVLPN